MSLITGQMNHKEYFKTAHIVFEVTFVSEILSCSSKADSYKKL